MPRPSAAGRRRRPLIAATAALLVPALAGCTASFGAQTQQPYIPAMGESAETGESDELKLRNIVAVAEEDGRATLVGTIVNSGDDADTLAGVNVADGSAEVSESNHSLRGVTRLGWAAEGDFVTVILDSPDIVPGHTVPVTIRFGTAAPVRIDTQVVGNTGAFADVSVPEPSTPPAHTPEDESADDS